jgi:nucleoside-diphosphate-sugar epimerase
MILVSGAAGNMGSRLVRGLVERGHEVRALVLPDDPLVSRLEGVDCQVFEGDITDSESLVGAFNGIETVYHLAAVILARDPLVFASVNIQGTRNMLEGAAEAGVKHFVYVSSASVVYPQTTAYSRSKRECERLVKQCRSMKYTIVRPTLCYSEDGGLEFDLFWDYLKKCPLVVPFVGSGAALKNPVHVDDLVAGLVSLAGCEKAYDKIYNFCGGEEISIGELARLMLRVDGAKKFLFPVPVSFCRAAAWALEKVMKNPPLTWNAVAGVTQDANLDRSEAERDLGYKPIGVREGFKRCFPGG